MALLLSGCANRALASLGWVRKLGAPRLPLLSQCPAPGIPSPSSCAEGPRCPGAQVRCPSTAWPPSSNVRPPPSHRRRHWDCPFCFYCLVLFLAFAVAHPSVLVAFPCISPVTDGVEHLSMRFFATLYLHC